MALTDAHPETPGRVSGYRLVDVLRVGVGVVSLCAATVVAVVVQERVSPEAQRRLLFACLTLGFTAFAWMMVALGRDVTRRWLALGASVGFRPGARRPVTDLGTDRPVLHGRAGDHPARMRLIVTRGRESAREWLELDTSLLRVAQTAHLRAGPEGVRATDSALVARGRAARERLAQAGLADARVRLDNGRLSVRAPFEAENAPRLVDALAQVADVIERS